MCALEDQRMRWWVWVVLAAFAAVASQTRLGMAFWWLSEQGRTLDRDSYCFGL